MGEVNVMGEQIGYVHGHSEHPKSLRAVEEVAMVTTGDGRDIHRRLNECEAQLRAIGKSQAVIEFDLEGTVLTANTLFLECLGYGIDEIRGRHHRMFCEPVYAASQEYQAFWS